MSLTGVVVPGSPLSPGGTLLSDVLATDTVLPLDDAADFAESFDEPRWLVIGGETTPREYVAVQNDEEAPPESVTLKVAVGGSGFEAGLPVTPWDPSAEATDKRATTWRVWVRLDGFEDKSPVPVFVEQNRVPTASDFSLEGARVELTEDELGDLWIERVLGRAPAISSTFVDVPSATAYLGGDYSIPSSTWVTGIRPWEVISIHPDIILDGIGPHYYRVEQAGYYLVVATIRWESNTTGRRAARITMWDNDTHVLGTPVAEASYGPNSNSPAAGFLQMQVTGVVPIPDSSTWLTVDVWQNSGLSLLVLGSSSAPTDTRIEIVRVA